MGIPRWCCSCFVVFNLILAAMVVESQDAGLYNTSSTCPTSSFYSSVRLNCAACPANQTTSGNGMLIFVYMHGEFMNTGSSLEISRL